MDDSISGAANDLEAPHEAPIITRLGTLAELTLVGLSGFGNPVGAEGPVPFST